ncbi:MAG: agmatinase [Firmicutes bacterium]|nr:agmatinase [Bacillota bacterium]
MTFNNTKSFHTPWRELLTEDIDKASVLIKGIPFDRAASISKGTSQAPNRIRHLSRFVPPITEEGIIIKKPFIKDEGNFEVSLNWEKYFNKIEKGAKILFDSGKFCIFLGGDHSVSIPLQAAFSKHYSSKKIGVIQFDAHCDLLNEYQGHIWSHACVARRGLENPNLKDEGLTLVGIRSFEEEEISFLNNHSDIKMITSLEIYEKGIDYLINELIKRYKDYDSIYISLDIDVLDPAFAPGTGTPEGGGISTREILQIVRKLINELPIKGMDIVEISPPLDNSDITSWAAIKIIYEVLGQIHLQNK